MSMLARLATMGSAARAQPSFVSSSINRITATANTVTAPAGIQDGDLLVAVGFTDTAGQTITPPTGFNLLYTDTTTTTNFIATKTASSESGNYTFTFNASAKTSAAILVYRNATAVNTIGVVAKASSATGTAASITPTYAGVLCCAFASMSASTVSTPPSGLTQRALSTGGTPGVGIYDLSGQSAAATSAYSLVWSSSAPVASVQFQVTNEPSVAPEFVASTNTQITTITSTLVINKPAGTIEGDLMIAAMAADANSRTWTGDTGWTELVDQGVSPDLRLAYKVAGPSEPSSYTFTISGGQRISGCIVTYRYAAYDTIAGAFTTGGNPLLLTSLSPTASQSVLLAVGARAAASITLGTPTSMTARVTDNDGTAPSYVFCDQVVANGPTGTRSMSTGSATNVAGIMLSIKPTRSLT